MSCLTGVRARQEKVAFAMCDDPGEVDQGVRPLIGTPPSRHMHPVELVKSGCGDDLKLIKSGCRDDMKV